MRKEDEIASNSFPPQPRDSDTCADKYKMKNLVLGSPVPKFIHGSKNVTTQISDSLYSFPLTPTPSLPLPLCKSLDIKRTLHFHYGLHLKISQLAFCPPALYQPLQSRPEVLSFADFVPPIVFTHAQRLNRIRKIMQDQAYRPPAFRINFTHLHHR